MANGILENLNRSLEITLRDNLDGLKEFTLMMASASVRPQFEKLPVERKINAPSQAQSSPPLTLIDTQSAETVASMHDQQKRRA